MSDLNRKEINKSKTYLRDGRAPIPIKEVTSRVMSANKAKNTKPEIILRKAIWSNGLRGYRLHSKNIPGSPDITFAKRKLGIFINGCFWHRCPHCILPMPKSNIAFWQNKFQKNLERDIRKIKEVKKLGWKIITIWECQIKKNLEKQVDKIKRMYEI